MEIIEEGGHWFRFRLDERILQFLAVNGIRSAEFGPERWQPGDVLFALKHTVMESNVGVYTGHHLPDWGSFSYAFSFLEAEVKLGRYCSISWNVRIMGPHHGHHLVSSSEIMYRQDTSFGPAIQALNANWRFRDNPQKPMPAIGHDVWIGQDVLLARGITLGHGSVVGAGSVVTKDVPAYAIVGGAPAKFIKWRFPERLIPDFLAAQWWDYALPQLNHLTLDDPERFLGEMHDEIARGHLNKIATLGEAWSVINAVG